MFRIKPTQLASFAAAAAVTFPERMLEFLQREMPEVCDAETPSRMEQAILRAHRWGLWVDLDVSTFVVLVFTHGPRFDEEAWAEETLARTDVPVSTRIHLVYEAAIRRMLVEDTALARKERP